MKGAFIAPRGVNLKRIEDGMLAFNLSVFFRNLRGEEVTLFATNESCTVRFTGGVEELVPARR